eukprot:scaffold50576_cov53-Phaeocystis_antarctica.AAC.3
MTILALLLAPSSLALHHSPLLRQSRAVQRSSSALPARMIALDPLVASEMNERFDLPLLSGLQGKAMLVEKSDIPTKAQVRQAVPKHCFERDTAKSMMYAVISVAQSARQHGQSGPLAVPGFGSRSSSGRAWWLGAARQSQGEAQPLGPQLLPRLIERAALQSRRSHHRL